MPHASKPHTTIHYERNGVVETLGRAGHLPARSAFGASVETVLAGRVNGLVTVRHHEAGMFGKPGAVVGMYQHEVK